MKLNDEQNLMKCTDCGFLFNNRQRIDFDVIYPDSYFEKDNEVGHGGGFYCYGLLCKSQQMMYSFASDFIKKTTTGKATVLELGCSFGFFLEQFKTEGAISTEAVEMNKLAVKHAKKIVGRVYETPFDSFTTRKKYDYIVFFEFLEHVLEPKKTLEKVGELLKDDRYAMIATPDAGTIWFKLLGKRWSSIHPAVHNQYFTKKTIRKILEDSNYEIISLKTSHFLWADIYHIRKRLSEMFPSTKLFWRLFSFLDHKVIPFFNGGDLRVIARKKAISPR
ncbi:MAG: class I SAM-dependent methyltransferase [Candidatus Altiarchaeota archaeon]|nr:class I SAM-dependent methyltransferase [Candidatus Altiarchaeota archaeon]